MAKKPKRKKLALLLVHGMGTHSEPSKGKRGAFYEEFKSACNEALQRYPQHVKDDIENYVDIHEFNYDAWFDFVRKQMAERSKPIGARIAGIEKKFGVSFAVDLIGKLASLESRYGGDEQFYTHWLDVIFYATLLGGKVRVDAGKKIAELVKRYGVSRLHILAHSLGTAVLHDTLALLYRPESDPEGDIPDLDLTNNKLASIWMVANVSRMMHAVTGIADPLTSAVKPGDSGCTNVFNSVRHKLDPFTWLSRFAPANNGQWVPETIYDTFYTETVTTLITNPNTHSLTQYIEDPSVSEKLFQQLLDFRWSIDDLDSVRAKYRTRSIQGAYALLEQELSNLSLKEIDSLRDFLEVGSNLNAAIKLVRGAFP